MVVMFVCVGFDVVVIEFGEVVEFVFGGNIGKFFFLQGKQFVMICWYYLVLFVQVYVDVNCVGMDWFFGFVDLVGVLYIWCIDYMYVQGVDGMIVVNDQYVVVCEVGLLIWLFYQYEFLMFFLVVGVVVFDDQVMIDFVVVVYVLVVEFFVSGGILYIGICVIGVYVLFDLWVEIMVGLMFVEYIVFVMGILIFDCGFYFFKVQGMWFYCVFFQVFGGVLDSIFILVDSLICLIWLVFIVDGFGGMVQLVVGGNGYLVGCLDGEIVVIEDFIFWMCLYFFDVEEMYCWFVQDYQFYNLIFFVGVLFCGFGYIWFVIGYVKWGLLNVFVVVLCFIEEIIGM